MTFLMKILQGLPACLVGNLKSIRYKRALTSALVKFSLKKSYLHFCII